MSEGVAAVQSAEPVVVQQVETTSHDDLASMFQKELEAERSPPKPEAAQPVEQAADTEEAPAEAAPEAAETQSEAEPADDTATAETDDGAETPTEDQSIAAPSGMTEADKAAYAKLPTELKAWVAKQEAARTADYTRKSQAIAAQKQQYDQTVPALMQRLQTFDAMLAKVTDNDIAPPDPALRNTDPLAYDEQLAGYMHAQHSKEVAAKERQKIQAEQKALSDAQFTEFSQNRAEELRAKAPELFGAKGQEIGKQIQAYASELGYTPEQLRLATANDIITLWKAQKFDAIEAAKKNVRAIPPPAQTTIKPGPAKGVGRVSRVAAAVNALSSNPSRSALAAAFAAELASERR